MTREELKKHCEKQIEMCEIWAISKGEKPSGKIYEEHKLILELLEQETILDKIRAEIEELDGKYVIGDYATYGEHSPKYIPLWEVSQIIDKYKESEE